MHFLPLLSLRSLSRGTLAKRRFLERLSDVAVAIGHLRGGGRRRARRSGRHRRRRRRRRAAAAARRAARRCGAAVDDDG